MICRANTTWPLQFTSSTIAFVLAAALITGWLASWAAAQSQEAVADAPRASADDVSADESKPLEETEIAESDREHWSFKPLKQPVPPIDLSAEFASKSEGKSAAQLASKTGHGATRTAIDAFIAQRLREQGLQLSPPASPRELLRRVTFDLTGLPPSPEALERWQELADLPDGLDRELDRLLASPATGEHLAQSWLDLARFAETDGFEHDKVRPEAWKYRDWVITAFNQDMPYDQFMALQIAGDLMPEAEQGQLATTFCLAGPDMPDLNDQIERRHNLLNEMTGTVGSVMLGLQLGCAACHDHKFDPISQADFYRLRGILESGVPELVRDKPWTMFREQDSQPAPRFYVRGDHRQPSTKLPPGVPRIAAVGEVNRLVSASKHPRLALAQWLASEENPLPARAMANRLWQAHFGVGLAGTPSDLGLIGIEPTHTELLDWLAGQLRRGDWSCQRLRRMIMQSAVYRAASHIDSDLQNDVRQSFDKLLAADPDNRLLGRYPRRRLSGEMIRDAMLSCAGLIDRQMGGQSVMPALPTELVESLLPGQWKASQKAADQARRSVYIFARRNLRYPIFESFDRPDAGASCPQRGRSVTATQSLLMFNSEFSSMVAEALASRAAQHSQPHDQARELWRSVLGRAPSQTELGWFDETISTAANSKEHLIGAALALLNCNEFITID